MLSKEFWKKASIFTFLFSAIVGTIFIVFIALIDEMPVFNKITMISVAFTWILVSLFYAFVEWDN